MGRWPAGSVVSTLGLPHTPFGVSEISCLEWVCKRKGGSSLACQVGPPLSLMSLTLVREVAVPGCALVGVSVARHPSEGFRGGDTGF